MAFIVEMIHGRSKVLAINEQGGIHLENLKDEDYAFFSCVYTKWDKMRAIGQEFGWKPLGSVVSDVCRIIEPTQSDYSPPSWNEKGIYKFFLAEDATNLANALQAFIDYNENITIYLEPIDTTLMSHRMNAAKYEQVYGDLHVSFLQKFISFIRKGEFMFVWDD